MITSKPLIIPWYPPIRCLCLGTNYFVLLHCLPTCIHEPWHPVISRPIQNASILPLLRDPHPCPFQDCLGPWRVCVSRSGLCLLLDVTPSWPLCSSFLTSHGASLLVPKHAPCSLPRILALAISWYWNCLHPGISRDPASIYPGLWFSGRPSHLAYLNHPSHDPVPSPSLLTQ